MKQVLSEDRCKQVGKPSDNFLPQWTLHPPFFRQAGAVEAIVAEEGVELTGGAGIEDESIGLIIVAQASAIQVSCPHSAVGIVHGHDFGVMKAAIEEVDVCPVLH